MWRFWFRHIIMLKRKNQAALHEGWLHVKVENAFRLALDWRVPEEHISSGGCSVGQD